MAQLKHRFAAAAFEEVAFYRVFVVAVHDESKGEAHEDDVRPGTVLWYAILDGQNNHTSKTKNDTGAHTPAYCCGTLSDCATYIWELETAAETVAQNSRCNSSRTRKKGEIKDLPCIRSTRTQSSTISERMKLSARMSMVRFREDCHCMPPRLQ